MKANIFLGIVTIMTMMTTTCFANNKGNVNNRKPETVVVINKNNNTKVIIHKDAKCKNHRHLTTPVRNCNCKHCKKLRKHIAAANYRNARTHTVVTHVNYGRR
ncbi:MAG: hypothetical protein K6E54_04410 [Bacteroidaceae bacterium]|nr:hypothetical protein [Bacteroidaceae bacterium]